MMIMRFHKLIQSKLLWLIFLGVLVFSFVGLALPRDQNQDTFNSMQQTVARVDGRAISREELSITRKLVERYLRQPVEDEELTEMALDRLARIAYARKLGIQVPLDAARIQYAEQFTNEDGSIDTDMRILMQTMLSNQGMTEEGYIRVLQKDLTLGQLERILASTTFVPPYEVERWAKTQTDAFTVRYAELNNDMLEEKPELTEEYIETFFNENVETFRIREKRKVSYIKLKAGDFLDQIQDVTEDDARFRYEQQAERYVRPVPTPAPAEGETEPPATTDTEPKTEKIPFPEVQEAITREIAMERAQAKAEEKAAEWTIRLMPSRGKSAASLLDIATEAGLEIITVGPFSRGERVPGVLNFYSFGLEIFKLDMTELGRVAEPYSQTNEVLVAVLDEIVPDRLPELEEVRDRVTMLAQRQLEKETLLEYGEELTGQLKERVTQGKTFEEALAEVGVTESKVESFQPKDFRQGMPTVPPALVENINSRSAGDIFGPIESRIGKVMVATVVSREPRPEDTASLMSIMKNQVAANLKYEGLQERFREQILSPMIERVEN